MSEKLKYEISVISNIHILAIIISLVLLIIFFVKLRRNFTVVSFCMAQLSLILWMFFKILKTVAPNEVLRWIFIVAYYFFIVFFELAIYNFMYSIYKNKIPKLSHNIFLVFLSSLQFIIVATNPLHHMFYKEYNMWNDSFGPLFFFNSFIEYSIIFISIIYGIKHFRNKINESSITYKIFMSSIIAVPLIANVLYISGILEKLFFLINIQVIFDITPITFIFSIFAFYYASFDKDLLEISPIMRHEIVSNLDTAICFFDSAFHLIYLNEKAKILLGNTKHNNLEKELKKLNFKDSDNVNKEIFINEKIISTKSFMVNTFLETRYLMSFYDLTHYRNVQKKIASQNMRLDELNNDLRIAIKRLQEESIICARNFVAKDLHDIIGHSLVVVIKLLEVAKLYYSSDSLLCEEALSDAVLVLDDGIRDMKSIRERENNVNSIILEKELYKVINRIKNSAIETHFNFKGERIDLVPEVYDALIKISSELISNSIKHGEPSKLFMSVNVFKNKILISFMDNGKGCDEMVEGNGIKGIRERLDSINGKVEFIFAKKEGFMTKIKISL